MQICVAPKTQTASQAYNNLYLLKDNFYHCLSLPACDSLFKNKLKKKTTEQFFHELNYNQTCIYYVKRKIKQTIRQTGKYRKTKKHFNKQANNSDVIIIFNFGIFFSSFISLVCYVFFFFFFFFVCCCCCCHLCVLRFAVLWLVAPTTLSSCRWCCCRHCNY